MPFNKITAANNSNFTKKVNTVKGIKVNTARPKAVISAGKGNKGNAVKASACWVWRPNHKVLDHVSKNNGASMSFKRFSYIDAQGRSKHMTGNRSYLTDYEEIDGGFVAFGGNSKGGKITRKDFKLTNESHVLLNVPKKDNMYIVDLKNVVPQGGLTCIFAKATPNESNLWNRRLGHLNFKTMNKLVRGNLVRGKKPALCFMRPFGCPITILNTIDHLGKFDGKADEGFFIGYSTNRKAFRVFNSRTKIVEENLHVKFSENTSTIAGSGPNWIFDIDALTNSMNYKTVVPWNQSNGNADPPFSSSSKDSLDAGFKPSVEEEKKDAEDPSNESGNLTEGKDSKVPSTKEPRINQEKDDYINSTNNINIASDGNSTNNVNAVNDDRDVGAEADMNNLDAFMPVSPIPTTRIHKDHLVEQIIKDLNSAPQTRRMTKNLKEHEAMQDELLQFKLQKVWTLVDLPNGKRVIGTKWVYKNKKDERGIVIKNKARLVAQGYTQEEGINYDEVFAPVARIEAIRLFLAYALFKDFVVYQMDVKGAFIYGKIEEEVYVFQPPGFEDPDFPDRVYKVEKALYGLHQAPRACDVKTASTPMEIHKPLLKDADGEDVDEHIYRSMIGSLMYLTSSRPDIMFVVCVCARFQVNPKVSHLHAVKRIFRYLKGQPKLGLWYPKDSPFDLVAYTDSDYAGASLDRKSTTGGCQFLGCRLISW
ncbi:putative ribonuclease H-like domain-containing protein [Tanacetum coccineum]